MAEEARGSKVTEGGWGWMIVAGCFLANICTRAVTRCVSIFFVEFQQQFDRDYSSTAWIHSTIDGITMLCAPLGGFLGNHFSCSLPYLYVTMGIITGLGFALSYTPSVAMVGNYFHERKALAYGIGLSGSGIGTFILAPAVQLLIELYSWRGALLVLGGFVANLCVCGALLRPIKPKLKADGRIWENKMVTQKDYVTPSINSKNTEVILSDLTKEELMVESMNMKNKASDKEGLNFLTKDANLKCISKEEFSFLFHPDFLILLVSVLFMAFGCSTPLVYLVPYALSVGVAHQNAAFLMSIFGISSIVGNITLDGSQTDREWRKNIPQTMPPVELHGAVLMEGWASFPALAVCVVLYGYFDGAYVALIPVTISDVVGPSNLTPALGVVYFLHAVPYLVCWWILQVRTPRPFTSVGPPT
ncbi:hypothetical protein WMY93_018874 [Mugilogobius chulae]|uniref:Major facilitator superfamily (MFS) profile domain-containing protein n=1 Tax=Mugilogobius chulae TaxID=88201 RepID=A0AAW0NK28_9GOBI